AVRAARRAATEGDREAARRDARRRKRGLRRDAARWAGQMLLRRALGEDGLRERLTAFWADHFTAVGKGALMRELHTPHVEQAVRPHVAGRFSEMVRAVATQPMMLRYLDQHRSVGPNSRAAERNRRLGGLNENLAREMLELHTLGPAGPYDQADVRELAELLTGLTFNARDGFVFRADRAEPGAETVLGVSYGGRGGRLSDIHAALDDLATHPATARHIAKKLAVHFVSDAPAPDLVAHMAARFAAADGDLAQVYAAMLEHPAAWDPVARNVKAPVDFVGSALRALDIVPGHLPRDRPGEMRDTLLTPLALMGQEWARPLAPDGWPEDDAAWITPQRLAARLQWAMSAPFLLRKVLPDPRDFVHVALGARAPNDVIAAARASESRAEGIGVVLASPAFQRH
ncbi:DUF1800 domain-containing protein, partial [Roseovarius salinarum]|uniref:DUF1800 domain-containing protein n=1 Tax=Roseovarius salinarum TaxID=1981892 RepID=UPI000C332086